VRKASTLVAPTKPLRADAMASRPVVILCQFLFPEMNATGELLTSLGTGLAGRGMTVTAYAAQPSYFGVTRVVPRLEHDGMVIRRLWRHTPRPPKQNRADH